MGQWGGLREAVQAPVPQRGGGRVVPARPDDSGEDRGLRPELGLSRVGVRDHHRAVAEGVRHRRELDRQPEHQH
ncbi:unnamed protein product [Linum tenue]|uniref:Uncharacterized protein n=1 Tax=Linum tenue TaxID=586396 RepID=A0AAV0HXB0_9ROSI|nr:unnamed protein product [Linum tenue]